MHLFNLNKNKRTNQAGQALLFVLVAVTIALAIGISISLRTLSTISRTARSDTAERVRAAAEGGVERALGASTVALSNLTDLGPGTDTCEKINLNYNAGLNSDACLVEFPRNWTDNIDARAFVTVQNFIYNDPVNNAYRVLLEKDSTTEVNVEGFSGDVRLCFSPVVAADIYYVIYGSEGILSKGGITSGLIDLPYQKEGFVSPNQSNVYGFSFCRSGINIPAGSYGLRITFWAVILWLGWWRLTCLSKGLLSLLWGSWFRKVR
jgi:hypothetical protein